jgi:hypothetical protein
MTRTPTFLRTKKCGVLGEGHRNQNKWFRGLEVPPKPLVLLSKCEDGYGKPPPQFAACPSRSND